MIVVGSLQVHSEKVGLQCDEIYRFEHIENNIYCTITDFIADYTTQIDCDIHTPEQRDRIEVMKFYTSRLIYMPSTIFRNFRQIRDLDISNTEIVELQRNNFEEATRLIYFTASFNNITELDAATFRDVSTVYLVDLSHNQILTIDKLAFLGAFSLSRLLLSHNKITTLHAEVFKCLTNLDQLYLDHNQIEFIDSNLFAENKQLSKLSMEYNRLSVFDTTVFSSFHFIDELRLSGNQLTHLNTTTFQLTLLGVSNNNLTELAVNRVQIIKAENNKINKMHIESMNTTRELLLANNNLQNIDAIMELRSLEILDLSSNYIGSLNISTFMKLKNLTSLNLANTHLLNLNFGTFAAQTQLQSLDLSYNNLRTINLDTFSPYFKNLDNLYIDGNNLTELSGTMSLVKAIPELSIIGISNNRFNCSYLTLLVDTLNLNKIKISLDPDQSISNSTHISGIACVTDNQLQINATFNPMDDKHFHYTMFLENDKREIRQLHEKSDAHAKILQSNMTLTIALICIMCAMIIVGVSIKITLVYMKQRTVLPINGIYRSTTTMNTLLQSNMDHSQ